MNISQSEKLTVAIFDRHYPSGNDWDIVSPALDPALHQVVMHTNRMKDAAHKMLDINHMILPDPDIMILSDTLIGDFSYSRYPLEDRQPHTSKYRKPYALRAKQHTDMASVYLLPTMDANEAINLPLVGTDEKSTFEHTLEMHHAKNARAAFILSYGARLLLPEETLLVGISGNPEHDGANELDALPFDRRLSREPKPGESKYDVIQRLSRYIDPDNL